MSRPLVVYHGPGCMDGMAAAWCMWQMFGENAEYVVGRYQSDDIIDFADRDVYLCDFSYSRTCLAEIVLPHANNVVMLDHHKSAIEDVWDLPGIFENFDMSRCTIENSGAMIAWYYFVEKRCNGKSLVGPPPLLKYIQDRDLWKFEYEQTRPISAALFSYDLDYQSIGKFMNLTERGLHRLVAEGKTLDRAHLKECRTLLKIASRLIQLPVGPSDCDTLIAMAVNCPPQYSSDIGNMIAQENCFGVTYYDSKEHREFSLRSARENPNHVDVSLIAKVFGGGGHKHAAGFKVKRNHYLARF